MKHPHKYTQIKINLIVLALLGSSMLYAQPGQRGRRDFEQIETEKIAFFTRYIELTSQEAKLFWPLYEDFQDRRNALIRERHQISARFGSDQEIAGEDQIKKMADRYIDLHVREAALVREYHQKFNSVLPPEKVMRLYLAENEFRMQLLRRVRGGRGWGDGRIDRE